MQEFEHNCLEIHTLIEKLPLFTGVRSSLPDNGLYFFFEDGESTIHQNHKSSRIVRVGTHTKQGRLQARLKRHYTGSKRSSVFLRYVGGALIRRDTSEAPCLLNSSGDGHWEDKNGKCCALCEPYKRHSKDYIKTKTKFTVVQVSDSELRDRLEKALISTVSLCTCCIPSQNWLGHYAYREKVKKSGLWQDEHVFDEDLVINPKLMRKFKSQVEATFEWFRTSR